MRIKPINVVGLILACAIAVGLVFAKTPWRGAPEPAATEQGVSVYFSPNGGCTAAIVDSVRKAEKTVDIQAFSFTSADIARALADAKERGVKVRAVLDAKEALTGKYSGATYLSNHAIATYVDRMHGIAHNKVLIIDSTTVITGSFNFTQSAETSNAENLLVITGKPKLIAAYQKNFDEHLRHSEVFLSK